MAQQAWIQNLTVRDNITFGRAMDVCKYQDTVAACELKEDFEMLPGGDLTEIGERVSNSLFILYNAIFHLIFGNIKAAIRFQLSFVKSLGFHDI